MTVARSGCMGHTVEEDLQPSRPAVFQLADGNDTKPGCTDELVRVLGVGMRKVPSELG
jgi:hypothetical protein